MGLDLVELYMDLEDAFECEIPETVVVHSVGELESWIVQHSPRCQSGEYSVLAAQGRIREMIGDRLGLNFPVLPEHHFARDLGC